MLIDKFFIQIKSSSEEKREDSDSGVAVATVEPKTKKPPLYRVIIFNDDLKLLSSDFFTPNLMHYHPLMLQHH